MTRDDEAEISVPITVQECAERAEMMAGLVQQIRAVKAQAKAKAFEYREQIEALMERLEAHARVVTEGAENRRQMDLTFPQEQAAQALHDIAAAACVCDDEDHADPACAVHGVRRHEDGTAVDSSERGLEDDAEAEGEELEDRAAAAVGEPVDVGTVEEPAAVEEFREAKARRGRRAAAEGGAA